MRKFRRERRKKRHKEASTDDGERKVESGGKKKKKTSFSLSLHPRLILSLSVSLSSLFLLFDPERVLRELFLSLTREQK